MRVKNRISLRAAAVVIACTILALGACNHAQTESRADEPAKEMSMTTRATGSFEVKLQPVGAPDKGDGSALGRMTIDKQFHGDLEATSKGEMLSAMTDIKGSAGYVAIERVTGTLDGRSGSFVLQHTGLMDRGKPQLSVVVVPDSGSGQLTGLTGTMKIIIEGGKHSYEFDYALPPIK